MATLSRKLAAAACCALLLKAACAGEFTVTPIRIDLAAAVRSAVITVRNDDKEKLGFQLQAMEWTQDESGKDRYEPTGDLIFFPKLMTLEPGQEGIIRVGAKRAAVPSEKTYRLFIEELPGAPKPDAPATSGAKINLLVRFGAPIFVAPIDPQDRLELERLSFDKGVLTLAAHNTGNRHQMVQGVHVKGLNARGQEVYAMTLADRYLLTGSTKTYSTSLAAEQCAKLAELSIEFKTDRSSVKRKLGVTRAMCP